MTSLSGLPLVGFLQAQKIVTEMEKIVKDECPSVRPLHDRWTSQELNQSAPKDSTDTLCKNLSTTSRGIQEQTHQQF